MVVCEVMRVPCGWLTLCRVAARAEPTRLAFHIGGVPFEDVRISHDAWPAMKATMPLGQVPVLEVRVSAPRRSA